MDDEGPNHKPPPPITQSEKLVLAWRVKPLLRGTLRDTINHWYPEPGHPESVCRNLFLEVWCPWCNDFHRHSWDPRHSGKYASHRRCHCTNPDSPFHDIGYWISTWRRCDPGYREHSFKPGYALVRPRALVLPRRKSA